MTGRSIEREDRRVRRIEAGRPGRRHRKALGGLMAMAVALSALPAVAQTVLAGPRLERDCEAPVIYSLSYVGESDPADLDRTVSTAGADCSVHAVGRAAEGEAADGPGTWYWAQLPEDQPRYLLLGFHDVEQAAIGWVQLRNTSEAWFYRTNTGGDWQPLPNRARRVLDWNGVSIALYNPPSEGDWSPLDIWYRFVATPPATEAPPPTPEAGEETVPAPPPAPPAAAPSS